MPVQITIEVPEFIRDELEARAASEYRSLEDFLLLEIDRIVFPTHAPELMEEIAKRRKVRGVKLTTEELLWHRDIGRI